MKIKYNSDYNFFNLFDEAQGIMNYKKNIYKDESKPIKTYTNKGFTFVKYLILILILLFIFRMLSKTSIFTILLEGLFALLSATIVAYYVIFYTSYTQDKQRCHRGELTINKNGILDTTDEGIRIGVPWHLIEALVITDTLICFTTKTIAFFYLSVDHVEAILEAVGTYQSDLKIIDQRIRKYVPIEEDEEEKNEEEDIEKLDNIDDPNSKEKVEKEEPKEESETKNKKEEVEEAIKELTED